MKTQCLFSVLLVFMNKASISAEGSSTDDTSLSCPIVCRCSMQEVVCKHKDLSYIPSIEQGADLVGLLDVSFNNVQLLSKNTFQQYPHLKTIDLSKNQIITIDLDAFHGVDYVEKIDLSENIIMSIHPDTFSENPNLVIVNFSGNPLMKLSTNVPILNSPTITHLDISVCHLTSLTPQMLQGMTNLKSLDIKNNDITYLPYEIVILLESLEEIKLNNNGWACDDCILSKVLNALDSRNNDAHDALEQVTCLNNKDHSRATFSVLKGLQACDNELEDANDNQLEDASDNVIVTEMHLVVKEDIWSRLQQHAFSTQTVLITSIIFTCIVICTVLCTVFVLRRSPVPHEDDVSQTKNKNLMLAFAEHGYKSNPQVPLLQFTYTPDDPPSCPPEWSAVPAERGQNSSLYHDFLMSRPTSEHIYDTIPYARMIEA